MAGAKGADGVTISGVGVPTPISVAADHPGEDLALLGEEAGFFPAVFSQTPDPMLSAPPTAALGPKLVMRWHVPSGESTADTISQDVYPYAEGGPLTYTAPGQTVFGTSAPGGWFRAPTGLVTTLTRLGVPDRVALVSAAAIPAAAPSPAPSADLPRTSVPWLPVGAATIAVLAGVVMLTRRRRRTARVAAA